MTVSIRKLSAAEAEQAFPSRRSQDVSGYMEALAGLGVGDAAEVPLNGLTTRAIKRRFGVAAKEQGKTLRWAPLNGGQNLVFMVRAERKPRGEARTKRPYQRRAVQAQPAAAQNGSVHIDTPAATPELPTVPPNNIISPASAPTPAPRGRREKAAAREAAVPVLSA